MPILINGLNSTTEVLQSLPKEWLTLELCEKWFKQFKKKLAYDEPIPPFETRFPEKLEGIINSVRQTFGQKPLNQTVLDATVAYLFQLVCGHPFQNGNKRMAILFTHMFLLRHGIDFALSDELLYHLATSIAQAAESKQNTAESIKKDIKRAFGPRSFRIIKNTK